MRMWLVDPKFMCNQHLLGEHVEMHSFYWHHQKRHFHQRLHHKRSDSNLKKYRKDIMNLPMRWKPEVCIITHLGLHQYLLLKMDNKGHIDIEVIQLKYFNRGENAEKR